MTNMNIIDEIINCGIQPTDKLLQMGAGYFDGAALERMAEYWNIREVVGVDANSDKVDSLSKRFTKYEFINSSMQEHLDELTSLEYDVPPYDWTVITGVFDNYLYGDMQHNFVLKSVQKCFEFSDKGTIFTLKMNLNDEFSYSPLFIFAELANTYSRIIVKKIVDNYVFCILK